jgi:hypothetical protein
MQNHRGVLILVLGILSLILIPPLGLVPWLMGNRDLNAMDAGTMDPEGRGLTQVGKILGIVAVILTVIAVLLFVLMIVFFGLFAVGSSI